LFPRDFFATSEPMTLDDALIRIRQGRDRMNALYSEPVFDEWAVIALPGDAPAIVSYDGPRPDAFRRQFLADIAPLTAELAGRQLPVGGFAFALGAEGTRFDACVRLGPQAYLLCNHTTRTMDEIRVDPRWLRAETFCGSDRGVRSRSFGLSLRQPVKPACTKKP
jgi:hypothetical protein